MRFSVGSFELAFLEHISVYEGDDDPLKKRSKAEMLIAGKSPMHKAFVIICYCNSSTTMSSLDDLETTLTRRRDLTRSNSPIAGSPIVMIPAYPSMISPRICVKNTFIEVRVAEEHEDADQGDSHHELINGSLVRKLPSYGRLSWLAFLPPWIMSTTSSCQPHHHVNHPSSSSWEVWRVWIHGWKHSRARNPVFFRAMRLLASPK